MRKIMELGGHKHVLKLFQCDQNVSFAVNRGFPAFSDKEVPCFCFMTELAEGMELFGALTVLDRFPTVLARSYFHQLMEGLNFCHEAGISHRHTMVHINTFETII